MSEQIVTEPDQHSILESQLCIQPQQMQQHNQNVEKTTNKTEDLIDLITHQIKNEIEKSRISISQNQKPFEVDVPNSPILIEQESHKLDEKKIADIVKKRKNLEQEIKRLNLKQQQQKKKSRSASPKQDIHYKTFRSVLTSEQQLQISRIIKKSQQFQQQLCQKQKQLLQKVKEERNRQQQEHKAYMMKLKQKKKFQALKKIKKIQEEQRCRQQKLKIQNKRYQQLKKSKALHEKIQQQHKALEQLKKKQVESILKQKRKSMILHIDQIKSHEKKYYQTARISKQKINQQFSERVQRMKQNQARQSQTYRPSKFLLTLWNEEKQKQIQQLQRIQKMKSLFNKKNSFEKQLRDIHKEKIQVRPKRQLQKSIIEIKVEDHLLKAKSMSAADIYKQGQEYMRSVHSSISPVHVEQSKIQLQKNYKSLKKGVKSQYKNYLHETRSKKEQLFKSMGKLKTKQNPEIHQLQNIISSGKQSDVEKLKKAKLIAQKLDQRAKNLSTSALIDSIAAKLKIIQEFN